MTEFQARRKGTRLTAIIVLIALVVGIGGGWFIAAITKNDSATPSSVYVTTADGASLIADGGTTLLTLKAVGNHVVKVDTETKGAEPSDAAEFFSGWNDTFGDEPRTAVVTATGDDGDVQLVLEVTNATFSEIGYVVQFDATVVSGPSDARDLTDVTVIIDAD